MAREAWVDNITGATGRWLLSKFSRLADHAAFFWVCLRSIIRYRRTGRKVLWRITVQQIYFTGVQAFELTALLAFITGALVTLQSISILSATGNMESLGRLLITVLVREIAPLLTAIVIILRSGSAIALEAGYMTVLGEMEGLEMQGIPVVHMFCVPRIVGVAVSVLFLLIFFNAVALAGGFVAGWLMEGLRPFYFFYELSVNVTKGDFFLILVKGICLGVFIPALCLLNGLQASGDITSIPPRVSRSLVECLIYSVFLNIMISVAFNA